MYQFMNVTIDQFVRRDGRETSKLVDSNNYVISSKGYGRIFPNTLASLTLLFGASAWSSEGYHLERRCGRRWGAKKR